MACLLASISPDEVIQSRIIRPRLGLRLWENSESTGTGAGACVANGHSDVFRAFLRKDRTAKPWDQAPGIDLECDKILVVMHGTALARDSRSA